MAEMLFLKYGDFKGPAIDSDHKDWIPLLSVSQSLNRPGMEAGGGGLRAMRGSVNIGELQVVKSMDQTTPKFIEHCCQGTVEPGGKDKVVIECCRMIGNKKKPFWQLTLTECVITSVNQSVSPEGEPTESISISAMEWKWQYESFDKSAKSTGKPHTSWKVGEGTE